MKVILRDLEAGSENPFDGLQVDNTRTLLDILEYLQHRDPFVFEMEGENGFRLTVGIGGTLCWIQHSSNNGDPPCLTAVMENTELRVGDDVRVYRCGGQATPFDSARCVPFSVVEEVSRHFIETGERSDEVVWIEL